MPEITTQQVHQGMIYTTRELPTGPPFLVRFVLKPAVDAPRRIEIVPAITDHVPGLAALMHAPTSPPPPGGDHAAILTAALAQSSECLTGLVDGVPVAMWGLVGSALDTDGCAWAAITDPARRFPRAMLREGRAWVRRVLDTFHTVYAFVLADDTRALKFARFLGFDKGEPVMDGTAFVVRMRRNG